MACENCPDPVIFQLRRRVQAEVDKLGRILELTEFFNDAVGSVAGVPFGTVNSAVNAIPAPLPLTPLDILGYLTCPLTPLALGLAGGGIDELTSGTVSTQVRRLKRLQAGATANAQRAYETALTNTPEAALIRTIRSYQRELLRIRFDATSFAEAVVIVASVQSVCGDAEFLEGPYQRFAELADGFSFTGGVPGTLDQNLAATVQKLNEGEAKLTALRAATGSA